MTRTSFCKHDWHYHDDGFAFICMKCGKTFQRTRDNPYPPAAHIPKGVILDKRQRSKP